MLKLRRSLVTLSLLLLFTCFWPTTLATAKPKPKDHRFKTRETGRLAVKLPTPYLLFVFHEGSGLCIVHSVYADEVVSTFPVDCTPQVVKFIAKQREAEQSAFEFRYPDGKPPRSDQ